MNRPPVTSRRASPRCRRSPPTRPPSSAPAAHPVPCAAVPSTTMAAYARGSTGTIRMARAAEFPEGEPQQRLLREGRIKARGLMPDCSNYTYLAHVRGDAGAETLAVYKPAPGETPLDDFPDGTLGKREGAAYLGSPALNWQVVPLTG